jgi:hypothetical protein
VKRLGLIDISPIKNSCLDIFLKNKTRVVPQHKTPGFSKRDNGAELFYSDPSICNDLKIIIYSPSFYLLAHILNTEYIIEIRHLFGMTSNITTGTPSQKETEPNDQIEKH